MTVKMKFGVPQPSSSIMSRARRAGVLSCWKVNMFPETCRSTPDFIAPDIVAT